MVVVPRGTEAYMGDAKREIKIKLT